MSRFVIRNAFLRGWFAARAQRTLPRAYDIIETIFMLQGFVAGKASGGVALPMLGNFAMDDEEEPLPVAENVNDRLEHVESDSAGGSDPGSTGVGAEAPEAAEDLDARGLHPAPSDATG